MLIANFLRDGFEVGCASLRSKTSGTEHATGTFAQVLDRAQEGRGVVQSFIPLAKSIEWRLGQRYLHERGSGAFLEDASPVPYVVNNDGTLSKNAAEVLFADLVEAERAGTLEPDIFVLELGIGVGLFARYFLDAFHDLCEQHGKDYYDRLTYLAGDRSEQMLQDASRHGVLARHAGRVVLRVIDALDVEHTLRNELGLAGQDRRSLRAVFLNYLLDCLPAVALEVEDDVVRQLCVRTCLARGVNLEDHSDLTVDQLAQRAGSDDPQDQHDLLEVYGLLASDYEYQPVDIGQIPYGAFAVEFARRHGKRVVHNHGAIQCLEQLLTLLRDDGFILINDYGQTTVGQDDEPEHQRFGHSTFIGVNFPLLREYFGRSREPSGTEGAEGSRSVRGTYCWAEPSGESQSIHSRLLGHTLGPETVARFQQLFHPATLEELQAPARQAREWVKVGRFEAAAACYRKALQRQPSNWVLMNEAAMFLTFSLRDPKAGADMARLALGLNPISAELWNTLGDTLFECGHTCEAGKAYRRALRINPNDVRARYNLAWVHDREKDYAGALRHLAEGLTLDHSGEYRERMLRKQELVLAALSQRQQQEYLRMANRIRMK